MVAALRGLEVSGTAAQVLEKGGSGAAGGSGGPAREDLRTRAVTEQL